MPELRKDPVTGRWVIISTERRKRPSDFRLENRAFEPAAFCPFCEGNEAFTPREVLCYRRSGGANGPGWDVRVVPNKYPALQVEGLLDRQGEGLFDKMNGVGAHEVIIETPEHGQTLATLPVVAIERVLWAFRERVLDLKQDTRFRSILVFKNHGIAAGAALEHPHSQLIALPIVPRNVRDEVDGARVHYELKERCVFCDIVRQEQEARTRVISENAEFVALAPYAPRFAFETWLLPKRHGAAFEDAPRHEYESLARMLKETLQRMNRALLSPPYSLIIHSAPFQTPGLDVVYHWHVEIMPTLTKVAGFEWGTGFYMNPTSPEEAAQVLRDAETG
jgi:UDPglucose--hexose-1-phosphate uridylyltransferase